MSTAKQFQYLESMGYAGSLADKQNAYYNDLILNGGQPDTPPVGEVVPDRNDWISATATTSGSQVLALTHFTARRTEAINTLTTLTGATAAAATPTRCRLGVYSVAANGDLSLIASTPDDTALWAATHTRYDKALSSTWNKVGGRRYALGTLVVSATTIPTFCGWAGVNSTPFTLAIGLANPTWASRIGGQSDLPASVAAGSLVGGAFRIGFILS